MVSAKATSEPAPEPRPGTDRNPLRLRPLDEVGDDQEVAGIVHALDDAELEGEPLVVLLARRAFGEAVVGDAPGEPLRRAPPQFARLVDGLRTRQREARQDRLARHRPERAALGDLDGRGERLRQVGELRHHLGAGLEAVLDGELAPVGLAEHAPLGDAQQRVVGLVVVDGRKERLVGGDERDTLGIGEIDERGLDGALLGEAVALQLDIEPVAERLLERVQARSGEMRLAGEDRAIDRAVRTAGERDQPLGAAVEPGPLDVRRLVAGMIEEGAGVEMQQVAVAGLGRGEQHEARHRGDRRAARPHLVFLVATVDRQRTADDRLDARARHLVGEFERAEHVVAVGEGQRRLMVGLGELGELGDRQRPLEQRVGRMHVEMNKSGHCSPVSRL